HYFSANPNGEAEVITVNLRQQGSIKKIKWDIDFTDILIKGRSSKGNLVTKYNIKKVDLKEEGVSTLKPRKIWFDDTVQRLNVDGRGELLGEFKGEDRLLIMTQKGIIKTIVPEVTARFDDDMIVLEKWIPNKPLTAIYFNGERDLYYVKRFLMENEEREESFIPDHEGSYLEVVSTDYKPMAELVFNKPRGKEQPDNEEVNLEEFIAIKGITAQGNMLTKAKVKQVNLLDPIPYVPVEVIPEEVVKEETTLKSDSESKTPVDPNAPDPEIDDTGQSILF
ncbi:MAG: DNA gyrase/topoisomerase IV subunit A, partial [Nonlabens sp.]